MYNGKTKEVTMWTVLSGIFGGLLRLMPEVFKFFTAKQEMAHELEMQKIAYNFQVLKGQQEVDMIVERGEASWNSGALDALKAGIDAQSKPSGIRWIDGLNSLVRPAITIQWVILLYPAVIISTFVLLIQGGLPVLSAVVQAFGTEEKALVAFIVDFWFVGRVLDAGRKKYGSS
jgi:hypothetical protein